MAWFAFDIDAYDADTMHLSAAEDGMYSRLLRFYYKTRVPLPDDDRALASIARVSPVEWETSKNSLRAFFKSRRGKLHHKRCDKELDREDSLARQRSEKAKNAAEKRHGKTRTSVPRANTEHVPSKATVMLGDATRPDQTREDQTKKEEPPKAPRKRVACLDSDQSKIFEEWYAIYPLRKARLSAEKAFLAALARASPAELMIGAARYRDECAGKEARYIAHPSTWLNAGRWKDELPPNGTVHDISERRRPTAPPSAHLLAGEPEEGHRAAGNV